LGSGRPTKKVQKKFSKKPKLPKPKGDPCAMTTATLTARRNQNLYRQPTTLTMGSNSATFVVIALISVLALLYLNQITKTGAIGYQVTDLSAQRDQLVSDEQTLDVEAARLESIQAIQGSKTVAGMVPTTQVSYAK
jgi:hypothetical protein